MIKNKIANLISDDEILIIYSGNTKNKNHDVDYPFRCNSNFWYLTNLNQQNCCIIFYKDESSLKSTLFCEQPSKFNKIWSDDILSFSEAKSLSNADSVEDISNLENFIIEMKKKKILCNEDRLNHIMHALRSIKTNYEISKIQKAIDVTIEAFLKVYNNLTNYSYEYEIQADILHTFYKNNMDWGYWPIIGSGANTCVLHYTKNNSIINKEQLLLIDAGASNEFYSADLTRTIPTNKIFTKKQKLIYQIVLDAQYYAIELVKPGISLREINDLTRIFLLNEIRKYNIEDDIDNVFPHLISHSLGIDVHDGLNNDILKENMIITIEPGLYFKNGMYKNIGIRIEDDILVTKNSHINMSASLPKTIQDLQNL
jgi:Xaa-Pro aminopeptidase